MARKKADERVKLSFGGSVVEVGADSADRFREAGATDYVEGETQERGSQNEAQVQAEGGAGDQPEAQVGTGTEGTDGGDPTGQGTVEDKAVTRRSTGSKAATDK